MLDIGCGTGEATSSLMNRVSGVKEIYAVDRSSKFISYAKQINRDIDILYKQMDAEDEWPEAWKNKFTMVIIYFNYLCFGGSVISTFKLNAAQIAGVVALRY